MEEERPRKDFEAMLQRAEQRLIQGIVVWHVDRLFRQPRDLERLIDLADSGFLVIGSHGTRDLSNADDRFILRIEVAQAAKSFDDTSRRIKRRFQKYREVGRPVGGRPGFGFLRKDPAWTPGPGQDEDDRPNVSARLVARERSALRTAVKDMAAKVTDQSKVARLWNDKGLRIVHRELRFLAIERLSDSRYAQAITAARARVSERLAEVTREIEEIEALQAALSERLGRREITLPVFDASNKHLMDDLEPLLDERESLRAGHRRVDCRDERGAGGRSVGHGGKNHDMACDAD